MRSNMRVFVAGVIVFSLLLIIMAPSSRAENMAQIVTSIEVDGLARIEEDEFIDLASPGVGAELDLQELRIGIKRAFKKMIFQDIKVVSAPFQGGIKLTYIVKEIPTVHSVTIEGNMLFSDRQVRKVFPYKEGDDYQEETLEKAEAAILNYYQRKGYPDAIVSMSVQEIDDRAGVNIYITIEEGAPVIIHRVQVLSDVAYLVSLSAGDVYDKDEVEKIIQKLQLYYKDKSYINPLVGPHQFIDGELVIPVNPGQRLEVEFENNTVISTRKLKKEVIYVESEEVSDELTAEIADRIKKLYVSEGYYAAQVAAGVELKKDVTRVTFVVFEGKQVILRNIHYDGISISTNAVEKIVTLDENKPYNDNLVNSSKEALVRFYNALGYLDMEVSDVRKDFHNDSSGLDLYFYVNEGGQTKIAEIEIDGSDRISELRIRNAIGISKGSPYNVIDIGDARYRVLSLYGQNGFMDAHVDVESIIKQEKAFLTFKIIENKPSVIGKIILRGNNKTKVKIIMREFTLYDGDYYDQEEMTRIKQRLYKLGIFNEVSLDILEPSHEDNDATVKDMLVSLKESKAGSIEFSLGYGDYEEFRGSLDVTYRNLGGYHRQAGLRAEISSVENRYILNFKEPWLFNTPNVPLKIFLMREETRSVNIETREVRYKIDKFSFIAGIEKELAKGLKAGLNYEYSFTDTTDVQPGVILSKEDTGTLGIGSISPSLFYDTRDDPFDPTSGFIYGIVLKFASKAFLSEVEFIKGSFQSASFYQLYKDIVLAVSFRGGASYGFNEIEELPLIERFFLGGRSSMRGYSNDMLGPKGADDNPTGGNMFALANIELRYPLGKGFGLVTFLDSGNVWKTVEDFEFEMKYTAGGGLRYKTPVGPIRFDYGHKLNAEPGESSGEIHFSFGHAF